MTPVPGARHLLAILMSLGWLLGGCSAKSRSSAESAKSDIRFTEISVEAGIDFTHNNGARGKKYMPETVGSGVAFLDYDNDGRQDLLFVNSTRWPGDKGPPGINRLYRNLGGGKFKDVTSESGLGIEMYGMGAAVADFDNDGFQDIYLTALGPNRLFRNRLGSTTGNTGDTGKSVGSRQSAAGRTDGPQRSDDPTTRRPIFEDITRSAGVQGVAAPGLELRWKWSSGASWLDYDRDGLLDLFVLNYVKWSPKTDVWCGRPGGPKAYCPPGSYEGYPSTLYHNEGGGRFRDVSREMGIVGGRLVGKSFGIAAADYNGDGWTDVAIANDTWPNFLFINEGGKRFVERGVESGIAYGDDGQAKAGMGIDVADWNNDGRFGLLIGNFSSESLSLFRNEGDAFFIDAAHKAGMAHSSLHFLTFGLFFFDYDLDGWQDAFTANGHIDEFVRTYDSLVSYKERPLLFRNNRNGTFSESGLQCGLLEEIVGRGAAHADIDGDGDLDIAVVSNGRPARLYRNDGGGSNRWIRLRLEGVRSNRDGIGALVRVSASGITQAQVVHSGSSFLSENQRELTFGLGAAKQADRVEVVWPGGERQSAESLAANKRYTIREGGAATEDKRINGGSQI